MKFVLAYAFLLVLVIVMILNFHGLLGTRNLMRDWNHNSQHTLSSSGAGVRQMQLGEHYTSNAAVTWVLVVLYSGDDESARRAEASWFRPQPNVGRVAFGFYKNTSVACRARWTQGDWFINTRNALKQAMRCYPEGRFFVRLNLENKTDLLNHQAYVESLPINLSHYVGVPVESQGLVFASNQDGYIMSRESVKRLSFCYTYSEWNGFDDASIAACLNQTGITLTHLQRQVTPESTQADLCVVITFPSTSEPLKQQAHFNTASIYEALRPRVKAFISQPVPLEALALNFSMLNAPSTNAHGTPVFSSLILLLEEACPDAPFLAYANSDILFDTSLLDTMDALLRWKQLEFIAVGRRRNHDLQGILTIHDVATAPSDLFTDLGQDYFIFPRQLSANLSLLPPYVIGRRAYDNAINDWAFHRSILVDLSDTVIALHQTTSDGNFAGHSDKNPDMEYNVQLSDAQYDHGSTTHGQYATVSKDGQVVVMRRSDNVVVSRSRDPFQLTRRGLPVTLDSLPAPLLVTFGNAAYREMLASFLCNTAFYPPMHAHMLVIVTDSSTVDYLTELDTDATIGLYKHPLQTGHDFNTPDYVRLMLLRGQILLTLLGDRTVLWLEADAEYFGNLVAHPAIATPTTDLVIYWDGTMYGGGFILFSATEKARSFYASIMQRLESGISRGDYTNDQFLLNDELSREPDVTRIEFDRCLFRSGLFYHEDGGREWRNKCQNTHPLVQQHNWIVGNQNKIDLARQHGAWFLASDTTVPVCIQRNINVSVTMSNPEIDCFSVFENINCQTIASNNGLKIPLLIEGESAIVKKQTPNGWPDRPVGPAFIRSNGDIILCDTGIVYGSAGCSPALTEEAQVCPTTAQQTVEYMTVITQYWGEGYFHMVVEGLTRLAQVMHEHPSFFDGQKTIYVHSISSQAEQFARLFKLGPVISGEVLVTKSVIAGPPTPCGGHGWSQHANRLRSLIQPTLPALTPSNRPLVVKRLSSRSIINHDQLVEALGARVHTGQEPVVDQLKMFAESKVVVAPHGSGLANIVAMSDGTVVELQTENTNHCYLFLALNLGLNYCGYYENGATHQGQWSVDIDRLKSVCEVLKPLNVKKDPTSDLLLPEAEKQDQQEYNDIWTLNVDLDKSNDSQDLLNLHFVWIQPHLGKNTGDEKEMKARKVAAKWAELKHSRLFFWTRDEIVREFPELVDTLTQLSIAAWISDILRYHVVNRYGGLYLDTDVHFLQDPALLLEQNRYAFTVCEKPWSAPGEPTASECEITINAIIAAAPGHPSLICAIEESLKNTRSALKANGGKTPQYNSGNTGPIMWTQCSKRGNLPILPSLTFLPCPCCEECISNQYVGVQGAYGMHEWKHSWW